jgi:hypothetical protein
MIDYTILDNLLNIAKSSGEKIEGNCYAYHLTGKVADNLLPKQRNLFKFGKLCTNIFEIGFNAGHSSAIFLQSNPNVTVTCVDIGEHKYSRECYQYLKNLYNDRINVIFTSSENISDLELLERNSFDGFHIDGCHTNLMYIKDLLSSFHLLKDSAYVIFDDTQDDKIFSFMQKCANSVLFDYCKDIFEETTMYKHEILKFNRPDIRIISLACGEEYIEKWQTGILTKMDYCRKNNYGFIQDYNCLDVTRPAPWSKIRMVQRELERTDFIVWLDADTIIMNNKHRIEEFLIDMKKDHFLLIGEDYNAINSGVFIIKNCEISRVFLEDVYNQTDSINSGWWEQDAIIKLYPKYKSGINIVPKKYVHIFNAYYSDNCKNFKKGCFLIHFAGCGLGSDTKTYEKRLEMRLIHNVHETWDDISRYYDNI